MRFTTLALAAIVATACAPAAPAPVDTAAVRTAIDAANKSFLTALGSGDSVTAAANYADDAIIMNPGEPAWRGKAAILKGFSGMLGAVKVSDVTQKTEDVMVGGDLAVETGSAEMTLTPAKGKPMHDRLKYITTWKKQADGSWKIVRDINNSDLGQGK